MTAAESKIVRSCRKLLENWFARLDQHKICVINIGDGDGRSMTWQVGFDEIRAHFYCVAFDPLPGRRFKNIFDGHEKFLIGGVFFRLGCYSQDVTENDLSVPIKTAAAQSRARQGQHEQHAEEDH